MIVVVRLGRQYDKASIEALLPGRTIIDSGSTPEGDFFLETDGSLTNAEVETVRRRLESTNDVDEALQERAIGAYKNLQDYYGLSNPTDAQTRAVVRLLCRVVMALIRAHYRRLDAAD